MDINISKFKLKQLKERVKREQQYFFIKILQKEDKTLNLILKSHLFIESLIDDLLQISLPRGKKLLSKRFSEKIDIAEATNLLIGDQLYGKMRTINNIRNHFSHNLNYKISSKDVVPLIINLKISKYRSNREKLAIGINYVIGYLQAIKELNKSYPFLSEIIRKHDFFKRDKGYKKVKKQLKSILEELRLEDWKI